MKYADAAHTQIFRPNRRGYNARANDLYLTSLWLDFDARATPRSIRSKMRIGRQPSGCMILPKTVCGVALAVNGGHWFVDELRLGEGVVSHNGFRQIPRMRKHLRTKLGAPSA